MKFKVHVLINCSKIAKKIRNFDSTESANISPLNITQKQIFNTSSQVSTCHIEVVR